MLTSTTSRPKVLTLVLDAISYEGKLGCGHSIEYLIEWETTFCGLCFMQDGYQLELPKRLHEHKQLAQNGNPQQSGKLISHVQAVEGIVKPAQNESLRDFRRTRVALYGKPSPQIFPFATSLWELMGYQPPLAEALYLSVLGRSEAQIAAETDRSVLQVIEILGKAVKVATNNVRKYDSQALRGS